jgi:hypothetical protein
MDVYKMCCCRVAKKNINVNEILPGPVGARRLIMTEDYGDWVKSQRKLRSLFFL